MRIEGIRPIHGTARENRIVRPKPGCAGTGVCRGSGDNKTQGKGSALKRSDLAHFSSFDAQE
jgi:hypothetical protein